jgi:hypothetical protein
MRDSSILPTLSTILLRMGGRFLGLLDETSDVVVVMVDAVDVVEGPAPLTTTASFPTMALLSSTSTTTAADVDGGKAEAVEEVVGLALTMVEDVSLRPMSEEGLVAWSRKYGVLVTIHLPMDDGDDLPNLLEIADDADDDGANVGNDVCDHE